MKRYIPASIFFAVLFASATSAHAQNCSTANQSALYNYTQAPGAYGEGAVGNVSTFPNADPCPASAPPNTVSYTVSVNQSDSCVNTNNNSTYNSSNRTIYGNGITYCNLFRSLDYMCNPEFYYYTTAATSATGYNQFYLQAFDDEYGTGNGCVYYPGYSRQDVWQCIGKACSSGGSRCGGKDNPPCSSPIILDVGGNGFLLTSPENGVRFDITGAAGPVQIAWTAPGVQNAFLCLPDSSGTCNSGRQLFGNFTPQPTSSTPNGYAALAVFDNPANGGNGDGVIDARDAVFSSLRLWIDMNHDGVSQPNELFTLPQLGVTSISLNYKLEQRTDQYGNVFRYRAKVGSTDGAGRWAYDVFLVEGTTTATNIRKTCRPRPALMEEKTGLR